MAGCEQLMRSDELTAIETMVAGVAHEVNTPLTGILIQTQLLLAQEFDEETKKCLQMILADTERIARIVQDCLSIARHRKPVMKSSNVNEILEGVIDLRAYEFRAHNIEVIKELEPKLPGTIADIGQLQQVFLNLVINAEHAMTESYGRGRLRVLTRHIDGSIRVSISDNGPGIPSHDLIRIFDPFLRQRNLGKARAWD